jgi:hypothetical protein
MLNLLPKDYRDKVRQEYIRRFFIVILIGFSIIDIFLLVAIFPSYSSISTRNKIAESAKQSIEKSSKAKDRDVVLNNVTDLESRLKVVALIPGDKPTEYINKALELRGKGIYIQSISYTKKSGTQKEISLEGVASSRSNLIDFSKRLKGSLWETSSDIPLSNLASDKDIKFLVNLTTSTTTR